MSTPKLVLIMYNCSKNKVKQIVQADGKADDKQIRV